MNSFQELSSTDGNITEEDLESHPEEDVEYYLADVHPDREDVYSFGHENMTFQFEE